MRAFEQSEEYKPSDLRYRLRDGLRFGYRQFQRMRRSWNFYQRESGLPSYSPRGHYYSPLPDIFEGQRFAAMAFNSQLADRIPGIDLQVVAQEELLSRMIDVYPEFDWSAHRIPGRRFHFDQIWYTQADSICLYAMLRLFRPRRVVEIGSGFTSALILDVNDRFLARRTQLTCIDSDAPLPDVSGCKERWLRRLR
jgi:hypothetical protein